MPAPLRIHLTPEEDARLRELETNPVVPFKVRRRAQAVRLAAQGWTAPRIGDLRRQAPRGQAPLDPGHERLPGGALGGGGGLDGPPAPGGFGEALLRDLPPGYGKAEAPGDGVPVGHAKAYVLTDAVCAHGEAHGGGEGEVCGRLGGGGKGGLRVFFLAALRSKHRTESGFGLSLPPTYAWARKGEAGRVPAGHLGEVVGAGERWGAPGSGVPVTGAGRRGTAPMNQRVSGAMF
jgi:hypothetical protein